MVEIQAASDDGVDHQKGGVVVSEQTDPEAFLKVALSGLLMDWIWGFREKRSRWPQDH